jgi:biotin carboxyl carrier protein
MADVTLEARAGDGNGRIADDKPVTADGRAPHPPVDPRAIRVGLGRVSRLADEPAIVVAPPPVPLAPLRDPLAGSGLLGGAPPMPADAPSGPDRRYTPGRDGGTAVPPAGGTAAAAAATPTWLVDGEPLAADLVRRGPRRATLLVGEGSQRVRHRVVFTDAPVVGPDGLTRREIVVDGWRIEVELEPERRASLRERARSGRQASAAGGPTEVRAIIPGRVVAVSIAPGDAVTAGQQVLVVEAMKMQNELRAPRDGTIRKVAVAPGTNIEVGDLLLVIE